MEKRIYRRKSIVCNCCGADIENGDYISIDKCFGYNSTRDGEHHKLQICEECYSNWIENFELSPIVGNAFDYTDELARVYQEMD